MIRKIRPDSHSSILVATNEGVFGISFHQWIPAITAQYTKKDGLITNEVMDVFADDRQHIFVATNGGVHRIDRNENKNITPESNDLKITRLLVNQEPFPVSAKVDLGYLENNIELNFQLLSYASNKKIVYYTRLLPLEKEWRKETDRSVFYLDLQPDDYVFELKAEDIYGNEIIHPPLEIAIHAPFWQTLWFRGGAALLFLAGVLTFTIQWDRKQKRIFEKEKALSRQMAELELSAIRAQMNPHFVFNALGAIQYYVQTNEVETADEYLTQFALLMRKFLDSTKEKFIPLKQEVELLRLYTNLEQVRFEGVFKVDISVQEGLLMEDYHLPSMLIQPFVENAINHGLHERRDGKGLLEIRFFDWDRALICEIRDNGVGRKNAQKWKRKGHKSKGMTIINDRIKTLKQSGIAEISVDVNDVHPEKEKYPGTCVAITIKNQENE
jgi:anti-sigma regulatory factor (Ser/Thr protein kinase)